MDAQQWYQGNDAYLAAALHWLRLKLLRLAESQQPPASPPPLSAAAPPPQRPAFWRRPAPTSAPPAPPLALPSSSRVSEDDLRAARAALDTAGQALSPGGPALISLGERLGLSTFEQQVLLLCAAAEFDTRLPDLYQQAHGRPYPTFALALSLFNDPAWDVLSPERPLRYWRLIEVNQPAGQGLTVSPLRADERIVNALKGLNYLDDRLSTLVQPVEAAAGSPLPASQAQVVAQALRTLQAHPRGQPWPVLQLSGSDPAQNAALAAQIAAGIGHPLYRLPVENLPLTPQEQETLARLWHRESLLAPTALYLDAQELDAASPQAGALARFLARSGGVMLLGSRSPWPDLPRAGPTWPVTKPTPAEQQALWRAVLGDAAGPLPARLAGQFNLSPQGIRQAAANALDDEGDTRLLGERLWDNCRALSRPRLGHLAQPVDVKADWNRLVLPAAERRTLREIADQARHRAAVYGDWGFAAHLNRGLGISALFTGESGTGKTLAAEVLAHELRLDLYRIDLASVVSKYIGETEKNLRLLFDAAEDGGAILFFDEADALFGKRSEVKDAHDRYANIEVDYLLQRMEAYSGLTILATNQKSALDSAFTRRLRFIVNFPFPGPREREQLWRVAFPARAQLEDLDYARLGKLNLTGAAIHSAALNAAFLSASAGHPIGMPDLLRAARSEYRKLERPVNEADFVWVEQQVSA